jgi:hypothetical protein
VEKSAVSVEANGIIEVIRNLQSQETDWVDLARVGVSLPNAGIDFKKNEFEKLRTYLESFSEYIEFNCKSNDGKPSVYYCRPFLQQSVLNNVIAQDIAISNNQPSSQVITMHNPLSNASQRNRRR